MTITPTGNPPRKREPIFSIPAVVIGLVAVLVGVHALLQVFGEATRDQIYFSWGFVPGRFTAAVAPSWIADLINRAANNDDALATARMLRDSGALDGGAGWTTFFTYALLHGSWAHVGVNSIWIVAFGPPVARRFGAWRFIAFFFFTSIVGAFAQWLAAPFEAIPMVGASAADSGLMAAAARFIFRPDATVLIATGGPLSAPASTLRELLVDRRAWFFIVVWMVTNFLFGAGATSLGASDAPVAWVAHVGGFLAGLLAFSLFDRRDASARPSTF